MVFKTDKNFVTKVALRGFTPPQLLRQFCLRQNRFYGLKHCYDDRPLACWWRRLMKKSVLFCILLILISINAYSQAKENLQYIKSKSYHSNIIFEDDKWISEELITIENPTDKKIIFEISGFFDKDYKKKNIEDTNLLQGYADKNKKIRFFEIESNETKEFRIFFIGKNSGKNQKANRLPVEKVSFSECKNTIKLIKTDYEIINQYEKDEYKRLELKISNEQIINMFNEFTDPLVVLYVPEKIFAKGIPFTSSSVPLDCDYMFSLSTDGKALLYGIYGNLLILNEVK